ncbi:MAG: hypothetical protein ACFBZ8_08595, partial [Opitutales bacterium]
MSDFWEMRHGFSPTDDGTFFPDQSPLANPDGDQHTNLEEAKFRTDPLNGSHPQLFPLPPEGISAPGQFYLQVVIVYHPQFDEPAIGVFHSFVEDVRYQLWQTEDLTQNFTRSQLLSFNFPDDTEPRSKVFVVFTPSISDGDDIFDEYDQNAFGFGASAPVVPPVAQSGSLSLPASNNARPTRSYLVHIQDVAAGSQISWLEDGQEQRVQSTRQFSGLGGFWEAKGSHANYAHFLIGNLSAAAPKLAAEAQTASLYPQPAATATHNYQSLTGPLSAESLEWLDRLHAEPRAPLQVPPLAQLTATQPGFGANAATGHSSSAFPPQQFFRVELLDPDSDGDGMTDYEEAVFGSNRITPDSDFDAFSDLQEYFDGTDPNEVDIIPGSLAEHIIQQVNSRLSAAAPPEQSKPVFTSYTDADHAAVPLVYTRNPDCWAADLDLTGISPWNSHVGGVPYRRGGTLISPRHIIFANHFPIANDTQLAFVTANNQTIFRTLTASRQVLDTDIQIGLLDSDVPSSITYYKVLPPDFAQKLWAFTDIPIIGFDQEEKAL